MSISKIGRYGCFFSFLLLVVVIGPSSSSAAGALPYIEITRPDRGRVFAVAWSPDAKYVAVGTDQGLWIYTDSLTDVLHVIAAPIHALAWSPDGREIAVGTFGQRSAATTPDNPTAQLPPTKSINGGGLQLWTVQSTGTQLTVAPRLTLLQNESVYALRFSPDSSQLAVLSQSTLLEYGDEMAQDALRIYATPSGKVLKTFPPLQTPVIQDGSVTQGANGLTWTSDGRYLAAIGSTYGEEYIRPTIWDSHKGELIPQAETLCNVPNIEIIDAVDWSSTGMLACGGAEVLDPVTEGGIGICAKPDFVGGNCQLSTPPLFGTEYPVENVPALAWRPGTAQVAYADGTAIRLWDESSRQLVALLTAARDNVTMLDWSLDGTKLLTSGSDYAVRVWTRFDTFTTPDPTPIRQITLPAHQWNAAVSPDGRWIANAETDTVKVIDTSDGHVQASFPTATRGADIHWSPDGNLLSISGEDPGGCAFNYDIGLQIWAAHTGQLVLDLPDATSLAWMPDSQSVAVGIFKGDWLVFEGQDVHTRKVLWQLPPSNQWEAINSLAVFRQDQTYKAARVSPDGRLLAIDNQVGCGNYDNSSVLLWDISTGGFAAHLDTVRSGFHGSGGWAHLAGWSSDGDTIPVAGFDHFYLYRLKQAGSTITPQVIWRRPDIGDQFDTPFSQDGRYFIYNDTIWDATNGWPVFRFQNPQGSVYRWQGDNLMTIDMGYDVSPVTGSVMVFRDADILPRACQPADDAKLSCTVGGVP